LITWSSVFVFQPEGCPKQITVTLYIPSFLHKQRAAHIIIIVIFAGSLQKLDGLPKESWDQIENVKLTSHDLLDF